MNVWFAANIASNVPGGIATVMASYAREMERCGHEVRVVAAGKGPMHFLVFSLWMLGRFLVAPVKPDWIIARSTDSFFCALFIRLFGWTTRTVLHNHGWEEFVFESERRLSRRVVDNPTTLRARLVRFPLLRLTLRLTDACVSGTIVETRMLRKRFPAKASQIHYCSHGVEAKEGGWVDKIDTPPCFLSVANSNWKKNIDHTLEVFARVCHQVPGSHLLCAGIGSEMVPRIRETGIADASVELLSWVDHRQMDLWYGRAPYLISSSRYEGGHSLAILEALSNGVVVFASSIASTREIITDGRNGFLITGSDVLQDAATIAAVIDNRALCDSVRKRAVETACRFSESRQTQRLIRLLEDYGTV